MWPCLVLLQQNLAHLAAFLAHQLPGFRCCFPVAVEVFWGTWWGVHAILKMYLGKGRQQLNPLLQCLRRHLWACIFLLCFLWEMADVGAWVELKCCRAELCTEQHSQGPFSLAQS